MAAMAEKSHTTTLSRLNHATTISLTLPANLTKTVRTVSTEKTGLFAVSSALKPGSRYPPIFTGIPPRSRELLPSGCLVFPLIEARINRRYLLGAQKTSPSPRRKSPLLCPRRFRKPPSRSSLRLLLLLRLLRLLLLLSRNLFRLLLLHLLCKLISAWHGQFLWNRTIRVSVTLRKDDDLDDVVSLSDIMDLDMDDYLDLDFDMFASSREAPFVASPGSEGLCSESDLESDWEANLLSPDSPFGNTLFPFMDKLSCPTSPCIASPSVPAVPCLDTPPPSVSVPPTPDSRPLSPTNSTSSSNPCTPAVSCEVKAEHFGQMIYQCSRCSIVYSTLEQIEKHLGQFHFPSRGDQGPFQLTDDNFATLVKMVWEAALTSSSYSGYIRRMPEPILSCSPLPVVSGSPVKRVESLGLRHQSVSPNAVAPSMICSTAPNTLASQYEAMDDTEDESDDSESCWDDLSSNSSDSSFDLSQLTPEMRIELEMPGPLLIPGVDDYSYSHHRPAKKLTKRLISATAPRKLHKPKSFKKPKSTASTLQDASRKISEMVACIGKMVKPKKNKEKNSFGGKSVPKTPQGSSPALSQSGDDIHSDGKIRRVKKHHGSKKALRKCRGVYGIHNQSNWCNMCKWKKRCSRFGEEDDDNEKSAE